MFWRLTRLPTHLANPGEDACGRSKDTLVHNIKCMIFTSPELFLLRGQRAQTACKLVRLLC